MPRQQPGSGRTRLASYIAVTMAVVSLVALPAGTGTAIAHEHGNRGDGRNATAPLTHDDRGHGNSGNSTAVAVNTTDDSLVFDLTFAVLKVTSGIVDNQNVADAYASCDGCQTVAISIQTLLVQGVANVVAPINEASARNQSCQQCDTVAIAYQFVVAPGTTLRFTPEGRREVAYIRRQLENLRDVAIRSGLTGAQIVAGVAALMRQYATILSTQLVPAEHPSAGAHGASPSGAAPPAGATSSTETTSSAAIPGVSTTTSAPTATTDSTTPTSAAAAPGTPATTPTSAPTDLATTSSTTGTTPTTTGTTSTTTGTTSATTSMTSTTTGTTTTGTTSTSGAPPTTTTTSGATPTTPTTP